MTHSAEMYRLVAKRTENLEVAELAEKVANVSLDSSDQLANSLVQWVSRMFPLTYGQVREIADFDEEFLAPVFMKSSELGSINYLQVHITSGRELLDQMSPIEKHYLDRFAEAFVANLSKKRVDQEQVLLKDLLKISIAGLAHYYELKNNHWAPFVTPVGASVQSDRGVEIVTSISLLLRTRNDAEELGLLDDSD